MPEEYPMPEFEADDLVKVRALRRCVAHYPPGPDRRRVIVEEGATETVPWAVAKGWWGAKTGEVLTEPKKPQATAKKKRKTAASAVPTAGAAPA